MTDIALKVFKSGWVPQETPLEIAERAYHAADQKCTDILTKNNPEIQSRIGGMVGMGNSQSNHAGSMETVMRLHNELVALQSEIKAAEIEKRRAWGEWVCLRPDVSDAMKAAIRKKITL